MEPEVKSSAGSALAERVAEYLRACGIGEERLAAWGEEVMRRLTLPEDGASQADIAGAVAEAEILVDAWLAQNLNLPPENLQARLVARAALPYWHTSADPQILPPPARAGLQECCLQSTPSPAVLEMPTQHLEFWSPRQAFGRTCRRCLPLFDRLWQKLTIPAQKKD